MKIPLNYSLMGGFELLNFNVEQIKIRSKVIDNEINYIPQHAKKKRGKFKRSGRR